MAYNPTCMETKQLNAKAQHQHIKSWIAPLTLLPKGWKNIKIYNILFGKGKTNLIPRQLHISQGTEKNYQKQYIFLQQYNADLVNTGAALTQDPQLQGAFAYGISEGYNEHSKILCWWQLVKSWP